MARRGSKVAPTSAQHRQATIRVATDLLSLGFWGRKVSTDSERSREARVLWPRRTETGLHRVTGTQELRAA